MKPTRTQAFELFKKYNDDRYLTVHALSVEAVMRHFASLNGEDEDKWGIIGLLHDLDFGKYPDEHCKKVKEILEEENYDEEYIHAIVSHRFGLCSDVKPENNMEWTLFTIDELTGLIYASALMRPSKSIMDMPVKSVKKKFKDKKFAAGVDREVVLKGAEELGKDMDYIIEHTLEGMRTVADEIGLGIHE